MSWKDHLGTVFAIVIVTWSTYYQLYVLKDVVSTISTLSVFVAMSFADASFRNHGVIKRLNQRISDLEEKLEKK